MKRAIERAESFKEWMTEMKTKRYTWAKLQRLAVHTLMRATKEELTEWSPASAAPYIRLLGMTQAGQSYLSRQKKSMELPFITKASEGKTPWHLLDVKAAQIYDLTTQKNTQSEYQKTPIIL